MEAAFCESLRTKQELYATTLSQSICGSLPQMTTASVHEPSIVKAAFQLEAFIQLGHQFTQNVPANVFDLVHYIVSKNERPADLTPSAERERVTRSASAEPGNSGAPLLPYPADWAHDKSLFKSDIETFVSCAADIDHQRRRRASQSHPVIPATPAAQTLTSSLTAAAAVPRAPVKASSQPPASVAGLGKVSAASSSADSNSRSSADPNSSGSTRHTSADEEILRDDILGHSMAPNDQQPAGQQPLGQQPPADGFTPRQIQQLADLIRQITGANNNNNNGNGNGNGHNPADNPLQVIAATQSNNDRFVPSLIGFFDPFYDSKSANTAPAMEHAGKDTYFRDIHVFLDRLYDIVATKGAQVVRDNLQLCLRGEALTWYTVELSEAEKRLVKYGAEGSVDEWRTLLLRRFKAPESVGMATLLKEKYTIYDAYRSREPREYAQTLLRAARTANFNDVNNQLTLIYNGLDLEFQRDIVPPTAMATLNDFMQALDLRKYQWWAYAARHHLPRKQPFATGQYASRRGDQDRPNSQFSSQPQNRSNAYTQPQSYQKANPEGSSRGKGNLPGPPARKLLSGPQPKGSDSTRRPFRQRQGQAQRAYQVEVTDEDQGQENMLPEEDEATEEANDAYHINETNESEDDELAFVNHITPPQHSCSHCKSTFASRNKLFTHLKSACWQKLPQDAAQPASTPSVTPDTLRKPTTVPSSIMAIAKDLPVLSARRPSKPADIPGFAFRKFQYTTLNIRLSQTGPDFSICADSGTPITFVDKKELRKHLPDLDQRIKESKPIPVSGFGNKTSYSKEYVDLDVYIPGQCQGKDVLGHITGEVHLTDALGAKMLLGTDLMTPYGMIPDLDKQKMIIRGCSSMEADISTIARANSQLKRTVRLKKSTLLPPNTTVPVPVNYSGDLPMDRDFFFEPQLPESHELGPEGGVYAHVVDASMSFVQVKNSTDAPVVLPKRVRLGNVVDMMPHQCYYTVPEAAPLATGNWKKTLRKAATVAVAASAITSGASLASPAPSTSTLSVNAAVPSPPMTVPFVMEARDHNERSVTSSMEAQASATEAESRQPQAVPEVDKLLEKQLENGVTIYGRDDASARAFRKVISTYKDIFEDKGQTVDIPEDQHMEINLKPGATPKPAKVYPAGKRDREVIDKTHDKLQASGRFSWSKHPTEHSYPVFVVWRDTPQGRKGRVVVDLRALNDMAVNDSYPLPLQSDIISLISGYEYITVVDAAGYFHQFLVKTKDRHKLTIVSHRGQEQSSVALMGYKGSPPYVQRQTDNILRPVRAFARAFVDDIVIFSHTLQDHVQHLSAVFDILRQRRIVLSPAKSFIGYPSVNLLGRHVDSLGMSTPEDKVRAITSLRFPSTLRQLEVFLGMTNWLRTSIPRYAQRTDPLLARKTALTRTLKENAEAAIKAQRASADDDVGSQPSNSAQASAATQRQPSGPHRKRLSSKLRYQPTDAEIKAFHDVQDAFKQPSFLVHYNPRRPLYYDLDASKDWGFAAIVYHIKGDPDPSTDVTKVARSRIEPIMFLSRNLNSAERNYWPTELEVAGTVWVVSKTRHMIETSEHPVVIYTDHSATVQIAKQTSLSTSSTDKLNLRLVRASQYLSQYNLDIRHKSGKTNVVPDALSRLPGEPTPQEDTGILDKSVYHITLVSMSDDFKSRLVEAYHKDDQWVKIRDILKAEDSDSTSTEAFRTRLRFKLKDDLIYYTNHDDGRERLCIPNSLEQEVFRLAHDSQQHGGYHRTFDRIARSVYIRHLSKHLKQYIHHCPDCNLNQTKRHRPYGEMQPVDTPAVPFHTITMDFISCLPRTATGYDNLLTVTDKFSKRVLLIPGKKQASAGEWAHLLLRELIGQSWGIPSAIISDRDAKFLSELWTTIFKALGTELLYSTTYHPQTDGQSERTNQTIEAALRMHCVTNSNTDWTELLPYIQGMLNNSTTSIGKSPNEILYGSNVRDTLDALSTAMPVEGFHSLRQQHRQEAEDAIAFASIMSKRQYDSKHKAISFKPNDLVYLRLHHGYEIAGNRSSKLAIQRVGPFKIIRKVSKLAYELELPEQMRIHPVVSVAQLEPAPHPDADPYRRQVDRNPPPVFEATADEPEEYTIERLLDRKYVRRKLKYLVKWQGWDHQHNTWEPVDELHKDLVAEYDASHPW